MSTREPSLTVEATKEIQSKLNKVSALIAADAETISDQQKLIEKQRKIIENQQDEIKQVRDELISMKKQILINEAKSTPQDFRDNLQKYLLNLRQELVKLDNQNKKILKEEEKKGMEYKYNDDDDYTMTSNGRTSLYIAAGRAIESKRGGKDRLFLDEYADRFASFNKNAGYNFISLFSDALTQLNHENNIMGEVTVDYLAMFVAFRSKWIDDSIYYALKTDKQRMREGTTRKTIKQIIILGVGCDTRSFRLSKLPKDLKIYHIDKIDVINFRKKILGNDMGICQYVDVECDLIDDVDDKWIDKLIKSGFDPNKKSIWICENILEYFNYDKLMEILKIISLNSFDGSWLIGEIPNLVNIQLKQMHDIWVNLGGQRVITGIDLPKYEILEKFGFKQYQHVNTLGTMDSNFNNRAPESYVKYQTSTKPIKGDKITRIQLFRGMKWMEEIEGGINDENDIKTPL